MKILNRDRLISTLKVKFNRNYLYQTRENAIRFQSWDGPPASLSLTEHLEKLVEEILNYIEFAPTRETEALDNTEEQRIKILQKVADKELTPKQADIELSNLRNINSVQQNWIDEKQNEAWNKMGDTGNYEYTTEKMNWNVENFWFGYYRALEDFECKFFDNIE